MDRDVAIFPYYRVSSGTYLDDTTIEIKVCHKKEQPLTWFATKQDAILDFIASKEIAIEKVKVIKDRLTALEKENECFICYHIEGDTYGIHTEYMYIELKINHYTFLYRIT